MIINKEVAAGRNEHASVRMKSREFKMERSGSRKGYAHLPHDLLIAEYKERRSSRGALRNTFRHMNRGEMIQTNIGLIV
jgi:hypothetical protein